MPVKSKENNLTILRTIGTTYVLDLEYTSQRRTPSTVQYCLYEKSTGKEARGQTVTGPAGRQFQTPDELMLEGLLSLGAHIDWSLIPAPQGGAPDWNDGFQ